MSRYTTKPARYNLAPLESLRPKQPTPCCVSCGYPMHWTLRLRRFCARCNLIYRPNWRDLPEGGTCST